MQKNNLLNEQLKTTMAQKIRHEVLSGISHDVRTPLNAIIGMGDLLAATDLTPQQQTYLNYLREASARLLDFVNVTIR